MKVKLDLNEPALKYRFAGNIEEAQAWLDNEVIADTDPYVPMDTGMMATAPLKTSVPGEVVYDEPYSAAQYYGRPGKSKDKHPQATTQWFEVAKAENKEKWLKGVKKLGGK